MLFAQGNVGEDFLVHRDDGGLAVQRGGDVGREEVQELYKEIAEEFFEQAVMVHGEDCT